MVPPARGPPPPLHPSPFHLFTYLSPGRLRGMGERKEREATGRERKERKPGGEEEKRVVRKDSREGGVEWSQALGAGEGWASPPWGSESSGGPGSQTATLQRRTR